MNFLQSIFYYFYWFLIFIFSTCLNSFYYINNITSWMIYDKINEHYDYIIVGGGSAGAILAFRLSENSNVSVLLIEAGSTVPEILNIPVLGPLKQKSEFDWQYRTVPQKQSCFGLNNNVSLWPSGKVLGGSTHLNYMVYLKGNENEFSSWKDPESDEWSMDDINNYFDKAEQCISDVNGGCSKDSFCNRGGSILVREAAFTTEFSNIILNASVEIGYNITNLNSKGKTGFMTPQVNINRDGKRWTSEQNLKDVLCCRRNLKVLTNAMVEKVLLKNGYEAYGVNYERHGKMGQIFAREEIILSAGTIGSAKILMLSGIGPKDVLSKSKIEVKIDLPVGKNLQDHITTGLDLVILNKTIFSMYDLTNPMNAFEYFINGKGPYTTTMVDAVGVVHSDTALSALESSVEFMVMVAGVSSDGGLFSRHSLGISDKLWNGYFSLLSNVTVASILPVLLHPKSFGEVKLDSKDPTGPPIIDPRYLSHVEDISTLIKGIRILQKLVNTDAVRNFGAKFNNLPLPGCESLKFDSDEYWKCYVQHLTLTSYHPVGTCKMGIWDFNRGSVVNHRLRVHKANKLRVIDASIMPTMPGANTNAAVVMIAEKGADLIKEDYFNRRSFCSAREIFLQNTKCD